MSDETERLNELNLQGEGLEARLALYESALEHMHQAMCVIDRDGRIALCNHRFAEVVRLPADKLRPGLAVRDLFALAIEAGYHPEGASPEELEREMWADLAMDPPARSTLERDGRTYAALPARMPGGYWIATFEDISAQVEAESALRESESGMRAILDAMPDCVKIFDETGRMIYINPAGLELLEAPDLASLDKPGHIAVPPEYRDACLDVHRRVMDGESVVWTYELLGLKGRRRHVEAHAVPFRLPDGSQAHMCISRDISERREADSALRRSEERLRLVQEATGLADFEAGPEGVTWLSPTFIEQTGLPHDTAHLPITRWLEIVHPEDREQHSREIAESLAKGHPFQSEFRIVRPNDGEVRWIFARTKVERNAAGEAIRSIGAHLDITRQKLNDEALRESEERFRLAAEAAGLGVWDYDALIDQREWSDRLRDILGIAPGAEPSLDVAEACIHPADRARFIRQLQTIRSGQIDQFEDTFRVRRTGEESDRWVTMNGRTHRTERQLRRIIMTVRDATEEKTAEERVRWTASHDPLTGLANRSLFQEQLDLAIQSATADGGAVGLLLLDLDHFKQINDTLGHDAGDMLLKMFAERVRSVVRANDTVARFGGDEFAVVLPDVPGELSLIQVSRSIHESLREPFVHAGRILDCRVSIGASMFPVHGRTSEALLKNADIALYGAKAAGRGTVTMFEPRMRDDVQRRVSMVQLARDALREDRIVPYYQPKLDLSRRAIIGFEALLRWRTETGRIGEPAAIAAAFEDAEVAAAISDRMIDRVIADMRSWLDRGIDFRHVAVNASAAEFRRDNFAERLLDQLRIADVPTSCFQIEVTETVFLGRGAEYVHRALALLNARGVKIALDDFGTGYASLRHLKQFPVDIIKIDRSFVRDMDVDPGDEAIIRAVVNLGRSLGIKVVAEGIETEQQATRLVGLECDFGQGFLFSKAAAASRVPGLVGRFPPVRASARPASAPLRIVSGKR